jgi:hypothetical protein
VLEATQNETVRHGGPDVEATIQDIRRMAADATVNLSVAIGELIVRRFYGGNIGAWRQRKGRDASFRALARHPGLPLSASGLYRSVCIYEMTLRIPALADPCFTPSHLRAVIGLAPDTQETLLNRARHERWTVRALEEEISRLRRDDMRPRGRKRLPAPVRWARTLQRVIDRDILCNVGAAPSFLPSELTALLTALDDAERTCAVLRRALVGSSLQEHPEDCGK